jgi:site-specific recombinase XerD
MNWDKRVNFDEWDQRFKKDLQNMAKEKEYHELKKKPVSTTILRHLFYTSILITQIENGSRISEAVEAILSFKNDGERIQKIRARKRKKLNKGKNVDVLIKIPSAVKKQYLTLDYPFETVLNGVKMFAERYYKINTHSLRYSWIAKMGREGIPTNLISKAIRHTNIQTIENYTAEDEADIMKMNFVK